MIDEPLFLKNETITHQQYVREDIIFVRKRPKMELYARMNT